MHSASPRAISFGIAFYNTNTITNTPFIHTLVAVSADKLYIFRSATDQSKKATLSVNTDAQSKAEVKIDSVSADATYDCVFKWGTVAEIRKNGLHIDIVSK